MDAKRTPDYEQALERMAEASIFRNWFNGRELSPQNRSKIAKKALQLLGDVGHPIDINPFVEMPPSAFGWGRLRFIVLSTDRWPAWHDKAKQREARRAAWLERKSKQASDAAPTRA